ncbi:glycoside hydrolase family 3 C-terminal domain-containing protein [Candidatus Soleaferrea massiliensis]|uniref:glycoside hydrolase family 3 C-terminal domain-containing protein n=1 Tax=Candidatus Soleaferrea massiliensis TaxID=1470354 RepID=UPI000A904350|nr:glycoside hydrolase family 3 C-terminal domain-containing protein [Candidatus Soleaferrea massiliensis]
MKQSKKILSAMLAAAMVFTMAPAGFVSNAVSAPGNIELSRQAATEGMVLLENNRSALPIPAGSTVALFGRGQIDFQKGGGGSGDVTVEYVRNLLQGMQEKQREGKVRIYQPLADAYTDFITSGQSGEMALSGELLEGAAEAADTAVVTISRYSQEGIDRTAAKGDYYLSDAEAEMLAKVAAAGFDKIAVVLNVGGIVDTSWFADSGADALLLAWQPGMEGGLATADILVGDVNPSGKLSDTFAKDYWDYPTSPSFHENNDYVNYTEDVFVGYRYFETFDPDYQKVHYEFGYGLSYTTFDITDVSAVPNGDRIEVSATVINTGKRAGKEVVQAYFSAPQMGENGAKLSKPARELAAFDKTNLLAPGESQTLTMTYDIDDMASYDDTGVTGHPSAYVLEAGDYDIYVGNSIRNAGENGVRGSYHLDSLQVAEQLSEKVKPTNLTERLLADGSHETLDTGLPVKSGGSTKIEAEYYMDKSPSLRGVESYPDGDWLSVTSVYYMYSEPADSLFLSYKLKVQQAGVYRLQLRAGNSGGAMYDFAAITVDGQPQPQARLYAPNTGGDNQLTDLDSVYISLPEGDCELKLTASSNRLPAIDFFTLERHRTEDRGHRRQQDRSGGLLRGARELLPEPDADRAGIPWQQEHQRALSDLQDGRAGIRRIPADLAFGAWPGQLPRHDAHRGERRRASGQPDGGQHRRLGDLQGPLPRLPAA